MILYHYTKLDAVRQILASGRFAFSTLGASNDPFDTPMAIPEPVEDPIRNLLAGHLASVKSHVWQTSTAILSLTRSPDNMLMWAHYADSHQGAVLEIDADIAGFTNVENNMIPAHFGSVIYARRRSMEQYSSTFVEGLRVGATYSFVPDHYEKLQRLFLTKPLEWAYEEEVRVAKCVQSSHSEGTWAYLSGNCEIVETNGRLLHCFEFPKDAVKKLCVGARVQEDEAADLAEEYPDITVFRAVLNDIRFEMSFKQVTQLQDK